MELEWSCQIVDDLVETKIMSLRLRWFDQDWIDYVEFEVNAISPVAISDKGKKLQITLNIWEFEEISDNWELISKAPRIDVILG